MKMEQIECSETSAFNNQTPGKYPKEYIRELCLRFLTLRPAHAFVMRRM